MPPASHQATSRQNLIMWNPTKIMSPSLQHARPFSKPVTFLSFWFDHIDYSKHTSIGRPGYIAWYLPRHFARSKVLCLHQIVRIQSNGINCATWTGIGHTVGTKHGWFIKWFQEQIYSNESIFCSVMGISCFFSLRNKINSMLMNYSPAFLKGITSLLSNLGRDTFWGNVWNNSDMCWINSVDLTMASGHLLQLVLAVCACLTGEAGQGISNISHQESSGLTHGAALSYLNGSVLLVLGGGPTVLLDRQRESQVNFFFSYSKKTLLVKPGACCSRAGWVSTGWASVTPLS